MTKEERMALEANTKALNNLVERMERICRQIQISNILKAKELGIDVNDMIPENDKFEKNIKRHGYEKKLGHHQNREQQKEEKDKEETENA